MSNSFGFFVFWRGARKSVGSVPFAPRSVEPIFATFSVKFRPSRQARVQDSRDLLKRHRASGKLRAVTQKANCFRGLPSIARVCSDFVQREARRHIAKQTHLCRDIVNQISLVFSHEQGGQCRRSENGHQPKQGGYDASVVSFRLR
jgi:hypothetical protein